MGVTAVLGLLGFALAFADSTRTTVEWQLARTDPPEGKVVHAWLTLAPPVGRSDRVSIRLASSAEMRVWFAGEGGRCDPQTDSLHWSGAVAAPMSHEVCARAASDQVAHLIAWVQPVDAARAYTVSSPPLAVRSFWGTLPSAFTTVLSVVLGFLTGLVSSWWQHRMEREAKAKEKEQERQSEREKHRQDAETKILDVLAPELVAARGQLDGFLAAQGTVPEPVKVDAGQLFVPDQRGALTGIAAMHLERLHELYRCLRAYNEMVSLVRQTTVGTKARTTAMDAAREMATSCARLLGALPDLAATKQAAAELEARSARATREVASVAAGEMPKRDAVGAG